MRIKLLDLYNAMTSYDFVGFKRTIDQEVVIELIEADPTECSFSDTMRVTYNDSDGECRVLEIFAARHSDVEPKLTISKTKTISRKP